MSYRFFLNDCVFCGDDGRVGLDILSLTDSFIHVPVIRSCDFMSDFVDWLVETFCTDTDGKTIEGTFDSVDVENGIENYFELSLNATKADYVSMFRDLLKYLGFESVTKFSCLLYYGNICDHDE